MEAWLVVYHYFLYDGSVSDILINYMLILLCSGLLVARPRPAWILLSFHTTVTVALQVGAVLVAEGRSTYQMMVKLTCLESY